MKILALESSAKVSSVALLEDEKVLASFMLHTGFTHSQTLMPMIDSVLKTTMTTLQDLDVLAVSYGPGSFTGIRIGISTVKGLAFAQDIPVFGASTLEAMAYYYKDKKDGDLCTCMDARNKQVYTANFRIENGAVRRLSGDVAMKIQELPDLWEKQGMQNVTLMGDGAELVYDTLQDKTLRLAPETLRLQNAVGVGRMALEKGDTHFIQADVLEPVYLRLPQAERELRSKMKGSREI